MAILKNGIYSAITGKLGAFVYYSLNGKTVVRTAPGPVTPKKPASMAQLANQQKFKLLQRLLLPLAPVIEVGFNPQGRGMGARAKAFSLNYRKAVTGVYPNLRVNYEKLQISKGNAFGLYNLKMEDKGAGLFGLTWRCCDQEWGRGHLLALMLYDETRNTVRYALDLANVSRQEVEFNLCGEASGKVHVYVFTIGKNKAGNSDSQYLGMV